VRIGRSAYGPAHGMHFGRPRRFAVTVVLGTGSANDRWRVIRTDEKLCAAKMLMNQGNWGLKSGQTSGVLTRNSSTGEAGQAPSWAEFRT